ncbi:MAG TPA: hypothetical protein VGF67_32750 [Ktedonobacteraceae bacterium]
MYEVLDTFPDERLGEPALPPVGYALATSVRQRSAICDALLRAVEQSAPHLGHLQVTRQFPGYAPPAQDE